MCLRCMVFSYPSLSSWNNLAIHWFFLLFWCRILCTNIVQKHSESVEVAPYNNSHLVKSSTLNRFPCQCRFYANSKSNHSLKIVAGLMLNKYFGYLSEFVYFAWWQAFTCISHAFSGLLPSTPNSVVT